MSADRIKEIRERVEKATAGPLSIVYVKGGMADRPETTGFAIRAPGKACAVVVAGCTDGSGKVMVVAENVRHCEWAKEFYTPEEMEANAQLFAHARQDIPWLLTELATAQAELARLKADALKVTTEATIEHVKNKAR